MTTTGQLAAAALQTNPPTGAASRIPELPREAAAEAVRAWLGQLTADFVDAAPDERIEARRVAVEQLAAVDGIRHAERLVDHALGLSSLTSRDARWPAPLASEALHGPAGQFVATVAPHSEADPAALLACYLATAGALFGPRPHVLVESTPHPSRLFVALVGRTSKARKGTAADRVHAVARTADSGFERLVRDGLASGEAVIHAVRDPVIRGEEVIDPGVDEKRLLVVEPEFGRILTVMQRRGSILSPVLRCAWDTGRLHNLTKDNPDRATGAHVVVVGLVTAEELTAGLDSVSMANGFANRFLWIAVDRSKRLPFGGDLREGDLIPLAYDLREAVDFAHGVGEVRWSAAARPGWRELYDVLSEGRPGLVGALTARAEAQTLRLALTFALLDRSTELLPEHLEAAAAVWDYAEASARFLFGRQLGHPLAERLLAALRDALPGGLTRTDLHEATGRHFTRNALDEALDLLSWADLADSVEESTGGRPRELWVALS